MGVSKITMMIFATQNLDWWGKHEIQKSSWWFLLHKIWTAGGNMRCRNHDDDFCFYEEVFWVFFKCSLIFQKFRKCETRMMMLIVGLSVLLISGWRNTRCKNDHDDFSIKVSMSRWVSFLDSFWLDGQKFCDSKMTMVIFASQIFVRLGKNEMQEWWWWFLFLWKCFFIFHSFFFRILKRWNKNDNGDCYIECFCTLGKT